MSDAARHSALDAIRANLRRTKALTDLQTLAASFTSTTPVDFESVLTSIGFGSTAASAVARGIDRWQVLGEIEELIAEMVRAGVTSWTEAQSAAATQNVVLGANFGNAACG